MSKDMTQKEIIKICKDQGCCDACCLRYIGLKSPNVYKNPKEYVLKYQDCQPSDSNNVSQTMKVEKIEVKVENTEDYSKINSSLSKYDAKSDTNGATDGNTINNDTDHSPRCTPPPHKKIKLEGICVCCLGVLQRDTWPESVEMVKDVLEKKGYESSTFACALSAPICTLLREKAIALQIAQDVKDYDPRILTPLKEAWKWSFAVHLSQSVNKELDSGAVSPLLVTLNMEYPDDIQELEILKTLSPALFSARSKQKRRFTVEFTRRSVEQALEVVEYEALERVGGTAAVTAPAKCISVVATAQPAYLGGRYIKLSRDLPQTPWLVNGKRMMDTSVQEIIFAPVAAACCIPEGEIEWRLKFISAGREDVDVRCLGDGRPFAIEITDPRRQLTKAELQDVCKEISRDTRIQVNVLATVTREALTELKKGEETKCKTYEALCIKLSHSDYDTEVSPDSPITVTERDLNNIAAYRNTPPDAPGPILLTQRTPIRVLHRRPLLNRTRYIYEVTAEAVPGHPQLLLLKARTQAGTYVKEWAHGELGRSRPALGAAVGARLDLLALDVARVHLAWP